MKVKIENIQPKDKWILVSTIADTESKIIKPETGTMNEEWLEVLRVSENCEFVKGGDFVRLDASVPSIIQPVDVEEDRKVGLVRETFVTATIE